MNSSLECACVFELGLLLTGDLRLLQVEAISLACVLEWDMEATELLTISQILWARNLSTVSLDSLVQDLLQGWNQGVS